MSSIYDFRIKQSVYVQALDTYRKMEALLQAEKENQQNNALIMKQNWSSVSADTFLKENNLFLESGNYRSTYDQVKGMREVIEDTLPEVNALLARCEGFLDQLQSDSYVEPIRPTGDDTTIRNGDILSLNYDMIAVLKDTCDIISEGNHTLRDTLRGIMTECRGEIDGTDRYLAELETASKKLDRVLNYRDSFQKYETGIRALEFDMNVRFSALSQNVKELCKIAGISEAELKNGIQDLEDIYNPLYMSEQELKAVMQQFLTEGNIEGMQQVANQIFAQDISEWNAAETEFIAETLNYGFEHKETGIIEIYMTNMYKESYTDFVEITEYHGNQEGPKKYQCYYHVETDNEKIQLVMNCLDARSQGEAYYSLNRIRNMQTEDIRIVQYNTQKPEGYSYAVNAEQKDGSLEMIFSTAKPNGKTSEQYRMTAYDMQEVISFEKEVELVTLGFTPKQIEEMRISAITDTDVAFMDKLSERNYIQAFNINPTGMSTVMGNCLAKYIMGLEGNNKTEEIQSMANGILRIDPNNCYSTSNAREKYFSMIAANLLLLNEQAKLNVLCYESGSAEEKQVIEASERIYKQYGLWTALGDVYDLEMGHDNLTLLMHSVGSGYCHAEISGLSDGLGAANSQYDFQVNFISTEDGTDMLDGWSVKVELGKVASIDYRNTKDRIELEALEKKKDEIIQNALLTGVTNLTDKIIPGSSKMIKLIGALVENNMKDTSEALAGFPYDEYIKALDKEGIKVSQSEVETMISAYFEYQEINSQIEEKEKLFENLALGQAVRQEFSLCDENGNVIENAEDLEGEGIILAQATKNLHRWEQEGLEAYFKDAGYVEEEIEIRKKELLDINQGMEEWETIINGGDISEITPSEMSNYLTDIKVVLQKKFDETHDISEWLRKGVQKSEE